MDRESTAEDHNPWMEYMRAGDFEAAWKVSDRELIARSGKPNWHLPRHFQNIWNGDPLEAKRVLIRCYHGLGDTIQFVRYASMVKSIAKEVILWAQGDLIPLLQTVAGIDQLLPLHDGAPKVEYDLDVEIMELPHVFRTEVTTIPSQIPYIHVPPMQVNKMASKLLVGLVWKAGDWDQNRNIPFDMLHPLFQIEGVDILILQANATAAGWSPNFGLHPGEFSLYDFARLVKAMDLVISVDSMPVHLAGALGVHVWNLLQANADWRWMRNTNQSPWYPTMKIFRQQKQGEWRSLLDSVCTELQGLQLRS